MGRPTEKELQIALNEAIQLREQGKDEFFIGKSLLNMNYRLQSLEHVLSKTKHYLHSGLAAREHTELLRVIELADKISQEKPLDDKEQLV